MNIKCPHCGTMYGVAQKDLGTFVTCESCGRGFVAGTKTGVKQNGRLEGTSPIMQQSTKNIAAWIGVTFLALNFIVLILLCLHIRSGFREMGNEVTRIRKNIDEINEDFGSSLATQEKRMNEIREDLKDMEKSRHNDAEQIYDRMGRMKLY